MIVGQDIAVVAHHEAGADALKHRPRRRNRELKRAITTGGSSRRTARRRLAAGHRRPVETEPALGTRPPDADHAAPQAADHRREIRIDPAGRRRQRHRTRRRRETSAGQAVAAAPVAAETSAPGHVVHRRPAMGRRQTAHRQVQRPAIRTQRPVPKGPAQRPDDDHRHHEQVLSQPPRTILGVGVGSRRIKIKVIAGHIGHACKLILGRKPLIAALAILPKRRHTRRKRKNTNKNQNHRQKTADQLNDRPPPSAHTQQTKRQTKQPKHDDWHKKTSS